MRWFLSLLVLTALVACAPEPTVTEAPTATTVVEEEFAGERNDAAAGDNVLGDVDEDITPAALEGAAERYTDEYAGYAFQYPADWQVGAGPRNTVVLTSYETADPALTTPEPDQTRIDFVPAAEAIGSYEAYLEAQRTFIEAGGGIIEDETDIMLPIGTDATRVTYTDAEGGDRVMVITEIDERGLMIDGSGDLTRFDEIIRTLEPAL